MRDFRKTDVETVLREFEGKQEMLAAFCSRTRTLIQVCLQDAGIRYQSVQSRVKSKKKLREKYLDPSKNYRKLEDITDLAGLRIITYYGDEVDSVARVIEREFEVDSKNSVDKRDTEPDRFGYRAINYVCEHSAKRISDVEYKRFAGVSCEIQITSILGHAWSEIEHEWYDLRDAYPDTVKRRFSRIAALFDLAESEFLDIRKSRKDYEQLVALRVEAKVANVPLDAVSLKSFIQQEPLVSELDNSLASTFHIPVATTLADTEVDRKARAANFAGLASVQELRESLSKYAGAVLEFVSHCAKEIWPAAPPGPLPRGTCIFHYASLVASSRGKEEALKFLNTLDVPEEQVNWDIARQAGIAAEVWAKYST